MGMKIEAMQVLYSAAGTFLTAGLAQGTGRCLSRPWSDKARDNFARRACDMCLARICRRQPDPLIWYRDPIITSATDSVLPCRVGG